MANLLCETCKNAPEPESMYGLPPKGLPVLKSSMEASSGSMLDALQTMSAHLRSPKYQGEICGRCEKQFADDEPRWGYRPIRWQFHLDAPHMRLPYPETPDEKFEQWVTLGEQKRMQAD